MSIRINLFLSCYLFIIDWVCWTYRLIAESLMECHVPNLQIENRLQFWILKNPIFEWQSNELEKTKNSILIFTDCLFISNFESNIPISLQESYWRMMMMMISRIVIPLYINQINLFRHLLSQICFNYSIRHLKFDSFEMVTQF